MRLVDQHLLAVSKAWRERADARAIVSTVEPSMGKIDGQVADSDALLAIGEVFKEYRALLEGVTERLEGFINWVVGVLDDRRVFLHVARTQDEAKSVQ